MSRQVSGAKSTVEEIFPELLATFTAHLAADALLFPLETLLHRLYLQGSPLSSRLGDWWRWGRWE